MAPRDRSFDDEPGDDEPGVAPDERELTARPTGREANELLEDDGDKVVPQGNVGGAAPTPLGMDSGGDLPGPQDDLGNLAEPEPPEAAEVDALHVRRREPEE
jgi:hypothetical protein